MGAPGLAMPQAGGGTGGTQAETAARKAREIYIGNLAIGIITPELLREFFDQVRVGREGGGGRTSGRGRTVPWCCCCRRGSVMGAAVAHLMRRGKGRGRPGCGWQAGRAGRSAGARRRRPPCHPLRAPATPPPPPRRCLHTRWPTRCPVPPSPTSTWTLRAALRLWSSRRRTWPPRRWRWTKWCVCWVGEALGRRGSRGESLAAGRGRSAGSLRLGARGGGGRRRWAAARVRPEMCGQVAAPAASRPGVAPCPRAPQVELCGRAMNIGRPKGYVAGAPQLPSLPKAAGAAPMPVPVAGQPSTQLLLSNLLPAGQLRGEEERRIVSGGGCCFVLRCVLPAVCPAACCCAACPAVCSCCTPVLLHAPAPACLAGSWLIAGRACLAPCPLPPPASCACSCKRRCTRRQPSTAPWPRWWCRRPRPGCRTSCRGAATSSTRRRRMRRKVGASGLGRGGEGGCRPAHARHLT